MSPIIGTLSHKHGQPDRRRAERRNTPELAAYTWNGSLQQQANIRDISATGLYLVTRERWNPGDMVSLTLQRRGPLEGNFERRVAVQARAVRWGEDGIALSFVLPVDMDLRLWQSPLKSSAEQTEPEDILREFRMAGALAFLGRLCPNSTGEFKRLLREGLSNYRVASAIEIALRAERLLSFGQHADKMRAPSNLVLRTLEDGSWADAESTQQLWAGLLATSCTFSGRDDSNMVFISLLSQLTATHVRILTAACTKGSKFMSSMERLSSRPIILSAQELMQITATRDMIRIHRDLEYLVDLGLLTTSVKAASFSPLEGTQIAPTSLGLQLFARCHGHRGATEDFYGVPFGSLSDMPSEAPTIRPDESVRAGR
jgi:PilZ domain